MMCPKCGFEQPRSESCGKCGVVIAKARARLEGEARAAIRSSLHGAAAIASTQPGAQRAPSMSVLARGSMEPSLFDLSFDGRIGRTRYVAWGLQLGLAAAAIAVPLLMLGRVGTILLIPVVLVALVLGTRASILRLHDLGLPGWAVIAAFVPVVGGLLSLALWVWPGVRGTNAYGEQPVPASQVETVLCWMQVTLVGLATVAGFALGLVGGAG